MTRRWTPMSSQSIEKDGGNEKSNARPKLAANIFDECSDRRLSILGRD